MTFIPDLDTELLIGVCAILWSTFWAIFVVLAFGLPAATAKLEETWKGSLPAFLMTSFRLGMNGFFPMPRLVGIDPRFRGIKPVLYKDRFGMKFVAFCLLTASFAVEVLGEGEAFLDITFVNEWAWSLRAIACLLCLVWRAYVAWAMQNAPNSKLRA